MTTHSKKPVIRTPSGEILTVMPGTEKPVSVKEMKRRRDEWRTKYQHLLGDYSVAKFLEEKSRDKEAGLE